MSILKKKAENFNMRSRGLNKSHLKALELLKTTDLPLIEVAKQSGMSEFHLHDLIKGRGKAGAVAEEFSEHYRKIADELDKKTAVESRELRYLVVSRLKEWAESATKIPQKMTQEVRKQAIDILNALKQQPTYNIGSVSYSRGLPPEEMVNEFKRLSALAESALDARRVRGVEGGGPRILPAPARRRDKAQASPKASSLSAESETGTLS